MGFIGVFVAVAPVVKGNKRMNYSEIQKIVLAGLMYSGELFEWVSCSGQ